jgi:23S rRNA pseudouridine2605 synthase
MTNHTPPTEPVRLNKYVASALAIGRRQVDELIEQGRILVNGSQPALGSRVQPSDEIVVDGQPITPHQQTYSYLALHKPINYVCSRRQQGDTPTIYALLPKKYHHLKPVGRLDKDSSGLLLLTNDGDFAHRMTHPSFGKIKRYEVTLDHPLQPLHHQMITDHGITLPDGVSKLSLQRLHDNEATQWLVTMHEGRNRQIRRTFTALGYTVIQLHRTQFGAYQLQDLAPGAYHDVTADQ